MTSIFLSYARNHDEAFVRRLHGDLTNAGFDVWFDRVSMPSRQLTFHQEIRDAIAARDRLLLVVGPGVLASDYVSQEWRFAYFKSGKCVNPIVRLAVPSPHLSTRHSKVWDLESGHTLQTLRGHSICVTGVAVFANGSRAISSSRDKTLKVWDLKSGRALRTLKGHSNWVNSVALDVDRLRAISTSNDKR